MKIKYFVFRFGLKKKGGEIKDNATIIFFNFNSQVVKSTDELFDSGRLNLKVTSLLRPCDDHVMAM